MLEDILLSIIPLGISALLFFLMWQAAPLKKTEAPSEKEMRGLKKRYRWFPMLLWMVIVVTIGVLGLLIFGLLSLLHDWRFSFMEGQVFTLGNASWYLIAIFGGMIGSYWAYRIFKRWFPSEGIRYTEAFFNQTYRLDANKAMEYISYILVPLILILTALDLNHYVVLEENHLRYSGFTELRSKAYPYKEIQDLRLKASFIAPNGDLKMRSHYLIQFTDGRVLNTRTHFPTDEAEENQIAKILIQKTGLTLRN